MRFRFFLMGADPTFFSERPILLEVADKLEAFFLDSKLKICNLSMPPRMGKSYLLTLFSVWAFAQKFHGQTKIFRVCAENTLFQDFSKQTQSLTNKFSLIFGFEPIKGTIDRWYIGGNTLPSFFGGGFGGNITGRGGNIAIFDDMYRSYSDAISAAYDRELNFFLQSVVRGRMEGDDYKIVNVGTRWAVNDWFSKFKPDVEIILPAINENGETLCEAYKSTVELFSIKRDIEPYVWDAQYMQTPTLQGRQILFKEEDLNLIDEIPQFTSKAIVIDPSGLTGNDNFVCGLFGKEKGQLYLIDMFAENALDFSKAVDWIKSKETKAVFIEVNGFGNTARAKLREAGINAIGFSTTKDKYVRSWNNLDFIKNYFHIYRGVPCLNLLLQQFKEFPTGVHDDLMDCCIMAVENYRRF